MGGGGADIEQVKMLCDKCKQNVATVHLTQMVDGKTKKVDLCEGCSKASGVDDPTGFSLADLLLGLGAPQEMEAACGSGDVKCPNCGFTQADFKKAGRLGCSECYQVFSEGLESLLKTMHKGTRHVGKRPHATHAETEAATASLLKQLQKALDKAVGDENFELAANIRDQIKNAKAKVAETT